MDWQDPLGKAQELCERGMQMLDLGRLHSAGDFFLEATRVAPDFPEAHFHYGQYLLESGQVTEAIDALRNATNLDPNSPEKLLILGQALCAKERFASAIATLRQAAAISPFSSQIQTALGNACRLDGQFEAAQSAFRDALTMEQDHVPAIVGLAHCELDQGRLHDALPWLKQALDINPEDFRANLFMGYAQAEQGRLDLSEKYFLAAIDAEPEEPVPYFNLGKLYAGLGRSTQARKALLKALEIAPDYLFAALFLAQLDMREGKPQLAVATLEAQIPCNDEEARLHLALADVYTALDKSDAAERHLRRTLELDPEQPDPAAQLSHLLLKRGAVDEALSLTERYVDSYIDHFPIQVRLAEIYEALGLKQEALRCYLHASRLEPENGNLWVRIGLLAVDCGEDQEAQRALDTVRGIFSSNSEMLLNIGGALYHRRRYAEAIPFFERVRALNPTAVPNLVSLAVCYRETGKLANAFTVCNDAVLHAPDSADVYYQRGRVRFDLKQLKDALSDFHRARNIDPYVPNYTQMIALISELLGKRRVAAEAYIRLLELDPTNPDRIMLAWKFLMGRILPYKYGAFRKMLRKIQEEHADSIAGMTAESLLCAGNVFKIATIIRIHRHLLTIRPDLASSLATAHREMFLVLGLAAISAVAAYTAIAMSL